MSDHPANPEAVSFCVYSSLPLRGTVKPVLVVAGLEDATFPVAETRAMADAIPGTRFVVLDKAAHLAALECPDEVNALIDGFLPA
jgi:3-oxoadipate enol-lactonase